MAIKTLLNKQSDFTGEFPLMDTMSGLWRMNDMPDSAHFLLDSSGNGRNGEVVNWAGTTAAMCEGRLGRYLRININNPTTEKSHFRIYNTAGNLFTDLGERIVAAGWINPTTYSVGNTYCPIFNTRSGPGQPIFYISLYQGRLRNMLYNSSGSLILDQTETPSITLRNGGWYFIGSFVEPDKKTCQSFICDWSDGSTWISPVRTFTGELNRSCTADIVLGMHANTYYYAGGFDDWFFDANTTLTAETITEYFKRTYTANGGDYSANVDALSIPDSVTLRELDGAYPSSGELVTIAVPCRIVGTGRVSVTSEYTAGVTAVSLIETSTSDDLEEWSVWQSVGTSGELQSPNRRFIRFRVTLTTTDASRTPRLLEIQLHDIPKPLYEKLGFSHPVILDNSGAWEAVLENAFDVIVTSEVNGADILEFKLPFHDSKRAILDNEKQVQIVNDIYRIRTLTDDKESDGRVVTSVYAEADFYDLAFSAIKRPIEMNADLADVPMGHALQDTGWSVGNVNVTAQRTWRCQEQNALAILRKVQEIYGGDLVFDSANKLVHLLTFDGTDSGALFCYRKNMKSIQRVVDTRSLVTRLYAYGKGGLTFESINNGRDYVEDFTYSNEIRIAALDCSNFENPYQMLEFAQLRLAELAQPRISYVMSAMDLSVLTGYEHETWKLGDIVMVYDDELNLSIKTRIVRRQYNLQEPWKTVLELSTTLRELGDASAQWDKMSDQLSQSTVIQDMKDMVPFNHLRNSRADDGFAYWENSGFEIDTEHGVSGTATFKAAGVLGMTKSMAQTVYPSSRKSYTFSAEIASENLQRG